MRGWSAVLFVFLWLPLGAQEALVLSDSARFSLLTSSPGDLLYASWGHSALRVFDPANRLNRCYNYGTFDFDQPNFYLNFVRGRLLYSLNIEPFRQFSIGNAYEQRTMQEQMLQLDSAQRQRLFALLEDNALPQNRDYRYDFFYDNCATRIRDILPKALGHPLLYDSSRVQSGATMRQLLQPYLVQKPWTGFGINLILGAASDKKAAVADYMFLPDGLHEVFRLSRLPDGRPLVAQEWLIPEGGYPPEIYRPGLFGRPFWVMTILVILGFASHWRLRLARVFDGVFFCLLGLAGLIIFLLWFATDHAATKQNLNLFWALPTHLLFFWRVGKGKWGFVHAILSGALAALVLVLWKFTSQEFPIPAVPLILYVAWKGIWVYRNRRMKLLSPPNAEQSA